MSEFKREDRYLVVKYSDIDKASAGIRQGFMRNSRWLHSSMFERGAPARCFLVIESDWPEYEFAWSMIEDRVLGKPSKQEGAVSAFSEWYASGSYDELSTATAALMAFKQGVAYALNSGSYKP